MQLKNIIKELCPPILWRALPRPSPPFTGDYESIEAARAESSGYDAPEIAQAMLKAFPALTAPRNHLEEREIQLLAAFSAIRPENNPLRVLDVGGAGGHYYYVLRNFLPYELSWTVLETKSIVDAFSAVASPIVYLQDFTHTYDVILLSGSLQYLDRPHEELQKYLKNAKHLVLNRLPLIDAPSDRLTVQHVNGSYHASYPAWFFSREKFLDLLKKYGDIRMQWTMAIDTVKLDGAPISFSGLLLDITSTAG